MNRITNRFLFVWSGRYFKYFCRLAVESALLADAEAQVELHLFGDRPDCSEHYAHVCRYRRVSVHAVELDECFAGLDASAHRYRALYDAIPANSHAARSNLIRYGLLHQRGGVYLDLDVLVLRDLRHLLDHPAFIGEERVWRVNEAQVKGRREAWMIVPTFAYLWTYALRWTDARLLGGRGWLEPAARPLDRVWSEPKLNNAVIGAAQGSAYIRRVLAAALEASPTIRFDLGPTLVNDVYRRDDREVLKLPPFVFFMEPPSYSFRFFHGRPTELPPDAVLVHYVSSNHRRLLPKLTPRRLEKRRSGPLFYRLAHEVAKRAHDLPMRSPSERSQAR